MKNIIFLLLNIMISALVCSAQDDEIIINSPKEVKAGNEFFITISIPKNYFDGVARIQFEMPNGMQARAKKNRKRRL